MATPGSDILRLIAAGRATRDPTELDFGDQVLLPSSEEAGSRLISPETSRIVTRSPVRSTAPSLRPTPGEFGERARRERSIREFSPEAIRSRIANQEAAAAAARSKELLQERTGRANLITANAALSKARRGNSGASSDILELLGLPAETKTTVPNAVKIANARQGGRRASTAEESVNLRARENFRKFRSDARKSLRANKSQALAVVREKNKAALGGLTEAGQISPEISEKINSLLEESLGSQNSLTSEAAQIYIQRALTQTNGNKAEAAKLATEWAQADGFDIEDLQ